MLQASIFRKHIIENKILDPEGTHHEFANYGHGRKLDFDLISDDIPLYAEWVGLNAQTIQKRGQLVLAVAGVANGTNRLARDVGAELEVEALYTRKVSPREVQLTPKSRKWLLEHANEDGLVIALEDVGTTGGTALTAIKSIHEVGEFETEGQFTWQRTDSLPAFDQADIPYTSIIHEPLTTYTPEQCAAEGYCSEGWQLIPHSKD